MDKIFRITVMSLLTGILVLLVAIYLRIPNAPPTFGDLRKAEAKSKQSLLMKCPLVTVNGSVDVQGTVNVDGTVDIGNTPLEVEVVR